MTRMLRAAALSAACLLLSSTAFGQRRHDLTIAAGQSVSSSVAVWRDSVGMRFAYPVSIRMPAAWTASDLVIEASADEVNWEPVFDSDGSRIRIRVEAGRWVVLDASAFWALPFIRFRSVAVGGTTDVNQGSARSISLFIR